MTFINKPLTNGGSPVKDGLSENELLTGCESSDTSLKIQSKFYYFRRDLEGSKKSPG